MKLTNEDVAFIAEMRTIGIRWKYLAKVYGCSYSVLRKKWNYAMAKGMK